MEVSQGSEPKGLIWHTCYCIRATGLALRATVASGDSFRPALAVASAALVRSEASVSVLGG